MNAAACPRKHFALVWKNPMFHAAVSELVTLRDCLRFAVSRFNEAGLYFGHGMDNAWDEAVYLALFALHLPPDLPPERLDFFLDARLLSSERKILLNLYRKRIEKRLPAAYLTREAWLSGYRFRSDKRAIVPRSFIAELLLEHLAPWIVEPKTVKNILDLCTGSGCLAILAALAFPAARVDAVDISPDALALARENLADYELIERIRLIKSDAFTALKKNDRYDLIISNPPYVDAEAMTNLPPEYRREPALALGSGEDGLDFTRRILAEVYKHLNPGGLLVVEIGHHRERLEAAFPKLPFTWLETSADNGYANGYVFLLAKEEFR